MIVLLKLFLTFFKIGAVTFGGGYAMIPMITADVAKMGWATPEMLTDMIAVSESTPGPFAINVATFIGMEQYGVLGAICATLGVLAPSFLIILIVAKLFANFQDNKYVKGFLWGVRPVVVGLIASAAFSIAKKQLLTTLEWDSAQAFFNAIDWKAVGIFVAVLVISRLKKLHPIFFILMSGAAGIVLYGLL